MKIFYKSITDNMAQQRFEEFHVIPQKTLWCCKKLNDHDSQYSLWNVKWAKFYFKDISPDGNMAFFPMYHCPYCGEKIEYEQIDSTSN
ncbi:hypothetical protein [Nitrosopumilus sp.]|uniref:hypothetical protein n=1 Tax=Nitrosopumilus sp. TaxID=2024843 RepID=UPI002931D06C|nr:hypothetical protein [Nitrosopumilus sp.]